MMTSCTNTFSFGANACLDKQGHDELRKLQLFCVFILNNFAAVK